MSFCPVKFGQKRIVSPWPCCRFWMSAMFKWSIETEGARYPSYRTGSFAHPSHPNDSILRPMSLQKRFDRLVPFASS
jgi:hypothetical protein